MILVVSTITAPLMPRVPMGKASPQQQRLHYTAVLKGFLSLITLQLISSGTQGISLMPSRVGQLWEMGLDFDHGTGHGVVISCLSMRTRIASPKVNRPLVAASNIMTIEPILSGG